jgi:hypothetical protein
VVTCAIVMAATVARQATAAETGLYNDKTTHKTGHYQISQPRGVGPEGVLVYFHGSGGGPTYAAQMDLLVRLAKPFNLAVVALQAPDQQNSWAADLPRIGAVNRLYVHSLLDKVVYAAHPTWSKHRTVFVGFSAGSTFLSGDFLPDEIDNYHGGAVLLCGGGSPLVSTTQNTASLNANVRSNFRLYYVIQTGDFLYAQTTAAMNEWKRRGLSVAGESPVGAGHCGFDVGKALESGLRYMFTP